MLRKHALQHASTFCVYYGIGHEDILKNYDLVIIEPAGHTNAEIKNIKQSGTLVIAYLSIMEINSDSPNYSLLDATDWLMLEGHPVMNEHYGNVLVDLRSQKWVNILYSRISQLLIDDQYDGIFLDTIGNLEWPAFEHSKEEQMQAAVNFVQSIKSAFPDYLLIQNNGIEELCMRTYKWIDAICWENPLFYDPHLEWCHTVINRLCQIEEQKSIRILLLYVEGENAEKSLLIANNYGNKRRWMISQSGLNYTAFPKNIFLTLD